MNKCLFCDKEVAIKSHLIPKHYLKQFEGSYYLPKVTDIDEIPSKQNKEKRTFPLFCRSCDGTLFKIIENKELEAVICNTQMNMIGLLYSFKLFCYYKYLFSSDISYSLYLDNSREFNKEDFADVRSLVDEKYSEIRDFLLNKKEESLIPFSFSDKNIYNKINNDFYFKSNCWFDDMKSINSNVSFQLRAERDDSGLLKDIALVATMPIEANHIDISKRGRIWFDLYITFNTDTNNYIKHEEDWISSDFFFGQNDEMLIKKKLNTITKEEITIPTYLNKQKPPKGVTTKSGNIRTTCVTHEYRKLSSSSDYNLAAFKRKADKNYVIKNIYELLCQEYDRLSEFKTAADFFDSIESIQLAEEKENINGKCLGLVVHYLENREKDIYIEIPNIAELGEVYKKNDGDFIYLK